ncbi:VTT domain-containing protein [Nocardioides sp. 503]|uniref:DedA family protein n=1 Tax=Nocardioides sp. 503 TaxID=2508326 RepID=UPI001FD69128|nr:VTT domain-containing protein [Nocardioides sp. 503]
MTALLLELHPLLLGMDWMDPQYLLDRFGTEFLWISLLIIFVECGLFFPFLPGDTLLLSLGVFIANPSDGIDVFPGSPVVELLVTLVLLVAAAMLGNVAGYEIGRAIGPPLYQRDGRILKKKYFDQTQAFFDKHGNKALVIGRFVPFVRTYITVVAGVTHMQRHRFLKWSFVGALLWVLSITLIGYVLGAKVPWLKDNIDYAIMAIIVISVIPVVYEWWKHRRHADDVVEDVPDDATADS